MPSFNIGFVIFPDLTLLDFTRPLQVLSRVPQTTTHIVAKSAAAVSSDCGVGLVPTHTFVNCPPLDLICVPGGNLGVVDAFCDRETQSLSAAGRAPRSMSPRYAPAQSSWVSPDCSRDGGQRRTGLLLICCRSSGPRTRRPGSSRAGTW